MPRSSVRKFLSACLAPTGQRQKKRKTKRSALTAVELCEPRTLLSANPILDPSFEVHPLQNGSEGNVSGTVWPANSSGTIRIHTSASPAGAAKHGSQYVELESGVQQFNIAVEPNSNYELTFWVKAQSGVSGGSDPVGASVQSRGTIIASGQATLGSSWSKESVSFTTSSQTDLIDIYIGKAFGTGNDGPLLDLVELTKTGTTSDLTLGTDLQDNDLYEGEHSASRLDGTLQIGTNAAVTDFKVVPSGGGIGQALSEFSFQKENYQNGNQHFYSVHYTTSSGEYLDAEAPRAHNPPENLDVIYVQNGQVIDRADFSLGVESLSVEVKNVVRTTTVNGFRFGWDYAIPTQVAAGVSGPLTLSDSEVSKTWRLEKLSNGSWAYDSGGSWLRHFEEAYVSGLSAGQYRFQAKASWTEAGSDSDEVVATPWSLFSITPPTQSPVLTDPDHTHTITCSNYDDAFVVNLASYISDGDSTLSDIEVTVNGTSPAVTVLGSETTNPRLQITPNPGDTEAVYAINVTVEDQQGNSTSTTINVTLDNSIATPVAPSPTGIADGELIPLLSAADTASRTLTWAVAGDDVDWELYRLTTNGDASIDINDLELIDSAADVTTTSYSGPAGGYGPGTYVFQIRGENCIEEASEWTQIEFMVSGVSFATDSNSESQCSSCSLHRDGLDVGDATATAGSGDLFVNLQKGIQTVAGWLSEYASPVYYANSPATQYAELDVTSDTAVSVEVTGGLDTSGRETTTVATPSLAGDATTTVRTPIRIDSSSLTTAYGEIGTSVTLAATFSVPDPNTGSVSSKTFTSASSISSDRPVKDEDSTHAGTHVDFAGISYLDDTDEGPVLHRANGTIVEYGDTASGFESPEGTFTTYGTYTESSNDFQTVTTATGDTFTYNDSGLLVKRQSMSGETLTFAYSLADQNADGLLNDLTSVTDDGTAEKITYGYTSGRVSNVTYSIEDGTTTDNHVWSYAYKAGTSLLEKITGPDGAGGLAPVLQLSWSTGSSPRLTSVTKTDDHSTSPKIYSKSSFQYDSWGNVSQITEESTDDTNRVWQISSAESRLLNESTVWQTGTEDGIVKDGVDDVITLPNGDSITREVDQFGNTLSESRMFSNNGLSATTIVRLERNEGGQVIRQVGPFFDGTDEGAADETQFVYDSEDRLTQMSHPDGSQESWTFNPGDGPDQPFSYTNQLGHYTRYVYDSSGRKTVETTYAYGDGGARVVSKFSYTWDGDKITQVFNYHGYSGEASGFDRPVVEYYYDDKDRLIHTRRTDAYGVRPSGQNDPVTGEPIPVDASLNAAVDIWETRSYDSLGFVGSISEPYRATAFSNGVPTSGVDTNNRTDFTNDARGNVLTSTQPDPDGASSKVRPVYTFEYDPWSQLTMSEIPGAEAVAYRQTDYTYDQFMQLVDVVTPDPDGSSTQLTETITRTIYDVLGNPQEVQVLDSSEAVEATRHLQYNSLGLLEWESQPFGSAVSAGSVTLDAKTRYEYDAEGRVLRLWQAGGYTGADSTYEYDDENRVVSMSDAGANVWKTTFDAVGRVVEETTPDPTGGNAAIVTNYTYQDGDTSFSRGGSTVHGTLITKSVSSTGATVSISDVSTLVSNAGMTLVIEENDPDGLGGLDNHYTTMEYDAFGRMLREADHNGTDYATAYASADTREKDYTYDVRGRLTETLDVDPDGSGALPRLKTVYNYDNLDRLTSEEWARPESAGKWAYVETVYGYNVVGEMVSETRLDRDGDATNDVVKTYVYDHLGRVESESRPNADNTRTATTEYTYNQRGDLATLTYPDPDGTGPRLSQVVTYGYGSSDPSTANSPGIYLTTEQMYAGVQPATTTYKYDDAGRMEALIPANPSNGAAGTVATQKWEYDDFGRVQYEHHLLASGGTFYGTVEYSYDELGRLIEVGEKNAADSEVYAYDELGRMESVTNLIGVTFTTEYDGWSRAVATTRSFGGTDLNTQSTTFDEFGRVASETSAEAVASPSLSLTKTYEYDFADRITKTTDPLAYTQIFIYRAWGPVLSKYTNEFNQHTYYNHDSLQRMIFQDREFDQNFITLEYNSYDEVKKENRILDGTDNAITTYTYDDVGLLTKLQEPSLYEEGPPEAGETEPSIVELPTITSYEYDRSSNLTKLIDPIQNETLWIYDARNRVTKEQVVVGGSTLTMNLQHWDNDLLRWDQDKNGDWQGYDWEFAFGAEGYFNVSLEKWFGGGGIGTGVDGGVAYEYDSSGTQLTKVTTHDNVANTYTGAIQHQTTYDYDNYGRMSSVEDYLVGDDSLLDWQRADTLSYYDALDRITKQSVLFQERVTTFENNLPVHLDRHRWDHATDYAWDDNNRVTAVTQHNADSASATSGFSNDTQSKKNAALNYFKNDQIQKITRTEGDVSNADALVSTYGLHNGGWVPGQIGSIAHSGFDNVANQQYTWTYQTGGRVDTFDAPGETKKQYVYDATDQLIRSEEFGNSSNVLQSQTYDQNGNLTGGSNSVDDHNRLTNDGTFTYEYDNEGQRTKRTQTIGGAYDVYDWDYRGRLLSVASYNSSAALQQNVVYEYDGTDRRLRRKVDTNGNGTFDVQERFVYSKNVNQTGYDEVVMVLDETADWSVSGETFSPDVEHRLMNGPMLDQVFADEVSNGDVLWNLHDSQYTVRDVAKFSDSNSNGAVDGKADLVNHLTYNDFGEVTAETNSSYSPLTTYTGQILDEYTGLMYYDARWFDTGINQFLSEDPLGFGAGDTNLRRYVGNSNPNAIDPSGLQERPSTPPWMRIPAGTTMVAHDPASSILRVKSATFEEYLTNRPWDNGEENGRSEWSYRLALMAELKRNDRREPAFRSVSRQEAAAYRELYEKQKRIDEIWADAKITGNPMASHMVAMMNGDLGYAYFGPGGFFEHLAIALSGGGMPGAACRRDFSRPPSVGIQRTNSQLVDDIAVRADRWGIRQGLPATGSRPGSLKHGYADRVLTRYQRMFSDRGLSTEVRYINGRVWRPGDGLSGTVRLDVVEGPLNAPTNVFDYKFGNATLTPQRINHIRGTSGISPTVPILEVKP